MKSVCYVGIGLLAVATQVQAKEWDENDITDILDKVKAIHSDVKTIHSDVKTISSDVKGDIKAAAHDLVLQQQKRTEAIVDTVGELLTWFESRRTPFLDFVNGGAGRCAQGSPCARFRADLRTFALHMAELKDRYPVLNQHGLGDTSFFPNVVNTLPPFILFGLHEMLRLVPDWKDLPVDLADIYDEIGDPEAFSIDPGASAQVAAASIAGPTKHAQAMDRKTLAGLGTLPSFKNNDASFDVFCSKGKEPRIDAVDLNRLKGSLFRWKNRFDSWSEYAPDNAEATLAGEGAGAFKPPSGPFLKTVSNAIDSILNQVDTYKANLEACAKIEADVAARAAGALVYRTEEGVRKAYWVVYGIVKRTSNRDAKLNIGMGNYYLTKARASYGQEKWKEAYGHICDAYAAL